MWQRLHDHQVEGVRWLFEAFFRGGGLLTDEPGLGKTLTIVALIEALMSSEEIKSVLVAAPANLVVNWDNEFHRWLGGSPNELNVIKVGSSAANLHVKTQLQQLVLTASGRHQIVILSYDALRVHGGHLKMGKGVDLLVADEAHVLAGDGARAMALRGVPARSRILMTGTPLSNNLKELFTVYDLARPGVLGTYQQFREDIALPIEAASQCDASAAVVAVAQVASHRLGDVACEMQLGRKAEDVDRARGLPRKHTFLIMARPTQIQRRIVESCNPRAEEGGRGGLSQQKGQTLVCLAAVNTVLLDPQELERSRFGSMKLHEQMAKVPERPSEQMALSGKLQVCARLLDGIRSSTTDKIVIVSARLAVLERVRQYVVDTFEGGSAAVWTLHGGVPMPMRDASIKAFNSRADGPRVCLLSSQLAIGINLVGANHLIVLAPSYNPSVDAQADARCHRVGQKKECYIYRHLTTGSIDETIIARQVQKGGLCDILEDGKLPAPHSPDIDLLFKLDDPECTSRLCSTMPSDSLYADATAWGEWEGTEPNAEPWLKQLKKEPLLEPASLQATALPNQDGLLLVSKVLRSRGSVGVGEEAGLGDGEDDIDVEADCVAEAMAAERGAGPTAAGSRGVEPMAEGDASAGTDADQSVESLAAAMEEVEAAAAADADGGGGGDGEPMAVEREDGDGEPMAVERGGELANSCDGRGSLPAQLLVDYPDDPLAQLLHKKEQQNVEAEATRARVDADMAVRMDTGIRVNPALAAMYGKSKK